MTAVPLKKFIVPACALLALVVIALVLFNSEDKSKSPVGETMTPEIRQALLLPPGNSPEEARDYQALVEHFAKESATLTIGTDCAMEPLVLKLKSGMVLVIANHDAEEHTVSFEDQNFFNVAAGGSRELNITETFQRGSGIYRYRCSDVSTTTNVGVMSIVD